MPHQATRRAKAELTLVWHQHHFVIHSRAEVHVLSLHAPSCHIIRNLPGLCIAASDSLLLTRASSEHCVWFGCATRHKEPAELT